MNSLRFLILLTFILYETQCAPSIKPLKFLKSLISKHLSSITEQPILEEEIYPAYKCESVEEGAIDDAAVEWNRQVFLVNEKPFLIEVGNIGQNQNEDLVVNPEINPEVNFEGNAEVNPEENPKLSPEEEHKNVYEKVYEKDENTQWFLSENTSERLPEINVGTPSIKDQLINKINIIKSKLKFKNRQVIPIAELVEENKNNVGFTSVKPTATLEPITTGKPTTEQHISAELVEENKNNVGFTSVKPIATLEPITTGKLTTEQHISTVRPITTAHQYTTTVQPITSAQPVVSSQYTTTVKPEIYTPDVPVNYVIESRGPIITIPTQNQMPLQPQQIYYSDLYYPLWLNNCPPPLSHQICYLQNDYYARGPKFTDTLNANQFTLDNTPYITPDYQKKKSNNGLAKVINYVNIDATQPMNPIKPNQDDEQWIRYAYENSKLVYQNPISYYIPPTANPEPQPEIVFPSSDGVYSTSTMEPIVVYSVEANINQVDQAQLEYNSDQLSGPATVNSNVVGSRYPLRGDIPFGEDSNPNINYDQPEGDSSEYMLKERRNVGQYNNDKKLASQNNLNVPFPESEISLDKPVSEQTDEKLIPANKIEISAVTETETPITKIETPITHTEKPILNIENPVVKNETPAVTLTEIPHHESNNVNIGAK